MKKQIYLHVPEPCHEDWNVMTPVQQGRFCQSCSKQVTDFSLMSDKQVLDVLQKASGNTCGRFAEDQLQRPMVKEIPPMLKPYKIFLSAFVPAFLLANSSMAQTMLKGKVRATTEQTTCEKPTKGEVVIMGDTVMGASVQQTKSNEITGKVADEYGKPLAGASIIIKGSKNGTAANQDGSFSIRYTGDVKAILQVSYIGYTTKEIVAYNKKFTTVTLLNSEQIIMGMMVARPVKKQITLKGKVVNEQGEGLPYASVKIDNYSKSVVSDDAGNFKIEVKPKSSDAIISASHVGYNGATKAINLSSYNSEDLVISLPQSQILGEVVVVSYPTISCTRLAGGVSSVVTTTFVDTAKTFIARVLNNEMFKIYPNPIVTGSSVNVVFKKAGEYSIQVFDNSGKLYLTKELQVENTKSPVQLNLPSGMSSGAYYIKAVATLTKKQFIDKIIVQ